MNGMFYRGEVYYVYPTGNEIGSEQHAGRPAIIVSNSQNNKNSSTLEIVYLTTREKRPMQTHVHINAAGKLQESTALCEQIFTVDKLRLNDYICQLCDKEMQDIEFGLMVSLGLDNYLSKPQPVPVVAAALAPTSVPAAPAKSSEGGHSHEDTEFIKVCVQRDTYKELCMELISRK